MIKKEYAIIHHDGCKNIVCTTTTKKGAEKLLKVLVEYVEYNYDTKVTEVMSYRNETFFANGHRVWIEDVVKVTGEKDMRRNLGLPIE